jgi:hypothetical protein
VSDRPVDGRPTDLARVRFAAHQFLNDPALAPLLLWWQASSLHGVLPPGPVDPLRLAMAQGDRERLLAIYRLNTDWLAAQRET